MYDFFKLGLPRKYFQHLSNHPNLNFKQLIDRDGVVLVSNKGFQRITARFGEFEVEIWHRGNECNSIYVRGSFHKEFEGGSNFRRFCLYDFQREVLKFCIELEIPANEFTVHNVEFGVNITIPISGKDFVEGIKTFKGKKLGRRVYKEPGVLFDLPHNQARLKIYDKGLQNKLSWQLVRIEWHIDKMARLKAYGNKFTLSDFLSYDIGSKLVDEILQIFESIIICPSGLVNTDQINDSKVRTNFLKGMDSDYWPRLRKEVSRKKYMQVFREHRRIFSDYSTWDLYSEIPRLILDEWGLLLAEPQDTIWKQIYPCIVGNSVPLLIPATCKRYCISCGREIPNPKRNQRFCGSKDVGEQAAHYCRNLDSNPRNNRLKKMNGYTQGRHCSRFGFKRDFVKFAVNQHSLTKSSH